MGAILSQIKGTDRDWLLQATTDGSTPATSLLASDTLAARVWPGGSEATTLTPTVTWSDATTGQFLVSFLAADTASLEAGSYRLQVTATRSGRVIPLFDGTLQLTEAPGTTAAPATYCSYADLLAYAPWLEQLQSSRDTEGFVTQRGLARSWLDNQILDKFRGGSGITTWPIVNTFGGYRTGGKNKWLRDQLTANLLMVNADVVEVVATYAISLICEAQIAALDADRIWILRAGQFRRRAQSKLSCLVAELDLNNDGYGDLIIHLGASNTLWA